MKRIEMTSCDRDLQWETQSWILVEFAEPHDDRDLEHFHAMGRNVRTATKDGVCNDQTVKDFKNDYTLLDANGHVMAEPDEEDLEGIQCRLSIVQTCHWAITTWGIIFFVALGCLDAYCRACWKRFDRLTKARLNNATFPASTATLFTIDKACEKAMKGVPQEPGLPCLPSNKQVIDTCTPAKLGGKMPPVQPKTYAMEGFLEYHTGKKGVGILCTEQSCIYKEKFEKFDAYLIPLFVIFLVFTMWCRCCGNNWVKQHQLDLQTQRVYAVKDQREKKLRTSGTTVSQTGGWW